MKRLSLLLLLTFGVLCSSWAARYSVDDIPNVQRTNHSRFTSNPDGILSAEAVAQIDTICYSLRQRGIAQIAVVAVKEIDGGDVFSFAIDLFSKWGVGRAADNNGLGILFVESAHEIRFVTGPGLEGVLPDAICKRIQLKYMLPLFRQENYSGGMVSGLVAIEKLLSGSELDLGRADDAAGEDFPAWMLLVFVASFILGPMLIMWLISRQSRRCPECKAHNALRQESMEVIQRTAHSSVVETTFVCSKCGAVIKRRTKSNGDNEGNSGRGGGGVFWGGLGGFGGGGSGGGFGGGSFGGGSFGGGGAGSRW
ncbi:MAG: TPM domain-containing protein [Alistipes sp.]